MEKKTNIKLLYSSVCQAGKPAKVSEERAKLSDLHFKSPGCLHIQNGYQREERKEVENSVRKLLQLSWTREEQGQLEEFIIYTEHGGYRMHYQKRHN